MLDWEVTGDLVILIINQFRPPVTARRERAEERYKLEEVSSGKKERAPAAENNATSVGGGKVATAEARAADTREGTVAAEETAAEPVAAKINVDRPLRVSKEIADDVAVTEALPPPPEGSPARGGPLLLWLGAERGAGRCP